MTYSYSLGAKVISEFVATCLTIFMGESVLANELLPSTKGHGMGLCAVSIGFGLAFGVNIAWFGFISAHLNPAMFFFLALIGKVSWEEFAACSCANFAGAFLGAVLVAIFFLPHFGFTVPLPSDISDVATFLEGAVSMDKNAGRIASAFGPASRQRKGETLRTEMKTFFTLPRDDQFLEGSDSLCCLDDPERKALLDKMKVRQRRRVAATQEAAATHLELFTNSTNKSFQVATLLHGHDAPLLSSSLKEHPAELRHSVQIAGLLHTHDNNMDGKLRQSVAVGEVMHAHDNNMDGNNSSNEKTAIHSSLITGQTNPTTGDVEVSAVDANGKTDKDVETPADISDKAKAQAPDASVKTKVEESLAAYRAALQADASAKLSIFATRPAIFNRPYNFLQESMLTAALVGGAELFNLRKETQIDLTGAEFADGPFLQSLFVALYITCLILGLGGPTGLAANPARDLGPRLAHQLLPLPGKGSSEWNYGLIVPLFGPLTGSIIAAGVYKGCEALFEMAEVEGEPAAGVEL